MQAPVVVRVQVAGKPSAAHDLVDTAVVDEVTVAAEPYGVQTSAALPAAY